MAINVSHLDRDTFARKVLEEGLDRQEVAGYIYARGKSPNDRNVLYRAYGPKWKQLYQARRVNEQTAAGGGALMTRISLAEGKVAYVCQYRAETVTAGAVALACRLLDEDGADAGLMANIGAAAGVNTQMPSIGSSAAASGNIMSTQNMYMGPGQILRANTGNCAQNDTLTVSIALLLPIDATTADITWDTTGSGGTPDLADSTISVANTLQAVLCP